MARVWQSFVMQFFFHADIWSSVELALLLGNIYLIICFIMEYLQDHSLWQKMLQAHENVQFLQEEESDVYPLRLAF